MLSGKLLLLLAFGPSFALGGSLGIKIRVVNLARVPAQQVEVAETCAGEVFRRAGIAVEWVDCDLPGACRNQMAATELWLQLLEKQPPKLHADAVGFALLTGDPANNGYAAVAWRAIQQLAGSLKIDPVAILGPAIAHELGHLLLGSQQHSRDGIMQARLNSSQLAMAARGELLFNAAQAQAIRDEVRRRSLR